MNADGIQINPLDMLAMIANRARQLDGYCSSPPPNGVDTQLILRHVASLYSFAEKLNEMALEANKTATSPEPPVDEPRVN